MYIHLLAEVELEMNNIWFNAWYIAFCKIMNYISISDLYCWTF